MKQPRNIDEVYREKLQNAESLPPADSWEYIAAHLPEKKKNILPLWLKLTGVAALLALLVSLFTFRPFQSPALQENPVTESEQEEIRGPGSTSTAFEEPMIEEDTPASGSKEEGRGISSENDPNLGAISSAEANSQKQHPSGPTRDQPAVLAFEEAGKNRQPDEPREEIRALAGDNPIAEKIASAEVLPGTNSEFQNSNTSAALSPDEVQEKSEIEVLAEMNAMLPTEAAEEASEKTAFIKRFRVSTTAAAVYFDHLGSGNTLDPNLANNNGGGEVSMSYGINLAYRLSDKVQLRSGINKVNLNYNTGGVSYATAMSYEAINEEAAASGTVLAAARGSLDQQLGFLEVPLEVEYNLINKKIGLDLIGGISTLFLEDNHLTLTSSGFSTDLGPAQNLNSLSFSANLGLGLHYSLTPQFRLNLEPIFKYQVNTFNNLSGLSPYYFGIYSGVSFGF